MTKTYDPIKFITEFELITLTILVSFLVLKFLGSIYDNIYEPGFDMIVNSNKAEKYYLKINKYYIHGDVFIKEFIKWFIIIIIFIVLYNLFKKN